MSLAVGIGQGYRGRNPARLARGPSPEAGDGASGLRALAAHLAVLLDLAAHVLGQPVDRVGHLRRGLMGAERLPLQAQRRLGHLAIGDRRVALLPELDVQRRQLRDLPADPAEALDHVASQFLIDLEVATAYLDPHVCLLRSATDATPSSTVGQVARATGAWRR